MWRLSCSYFYFMFVCMWISRSIYILKAIFDSILCLYVFLFCFVLNLQPDSMSVLVFSSIISKKKSLWIYYIYIFIFCVCLLSCITNALIDVQMVGIKWMHWSLGTFKQNKWSPFFATKSWSTIFSHARFGCHFYTIFSINIILMISQLANCLISTLLLFICFLS